jgi:hypothetical protein
VALTLAAAVTGCSGGNDGASPTPETEIATAQNPTNDLAARKAARERLERVPGEAVPVETAPAPMGEVPAAVLDKVISDATERTGVGADEIDVLRSESLIFSDGALGCPKPDVAYTPAPVPGYRVVLEADGRLMDYRVTERGYMMLCEQAGLPISPGRGGLDR